MIYRNPFKRIFHAAIYSINGLIFALTHEQAFRYEFCVLVAILAFVMIFAVELVWAVIFVAAWLLVMCFELVNSAVEKAFDLIDENFRPEIKAGKDMLSAAVFVVIFLNVILWLIFVTQKLF